MIDTGVFEDVVIKARTAADFVGSKTGEIVELSKMKISAAELESKIDKEYYAIGKAVYQSSKGDEDCSEIVKQKIEKVDALKADLDAMIEKISGFKGDKKCPECGKFNDGESNFCGKCGAKL